MLSTHRRLRSELSFIHPSLVLLTISALPTCLHFSILVLRFFIYTMTIERLFLVIKSVSISEMCNRNSTMAVPLMPLEAVRQV